MVQVPDNIFELLMETYEAASDLGMVSQANTDAMDEFLEDGGERETE